MKSMESKTLPRKTRNASSVFKPPSRSISTPVPSDDREYLTETNHARFSASTINTPSSSEPPYVLNLLDDGIAADVKKNDGIYSRHFTAFTAVGRYSITIKASDPDGTAVVRMFEYSKGDYGKSDECAHDPNAGEMEEIFVLPPQKPSKIILSKKVSTRNKTS